MEEFNGYNEAKTEEEKEEAEKKERAALFDRESSENMTDADMVNFLNSLDFWLIDLNLDDKDVDISEIGEIDCGELVKDKKDRVAIRKLKYAAAREYLPEGSFKKYKGEKSGNFWCWKSGGSTNEGGEELLLNGITREIPMNALINKAWLVGVFDKRATKSQKNILESSIKESIFQKQKREEKVVTSKGSFMTQIRKNWNNKESKDQEDSTISEEPMIEKPNYFPGRNDGNENMSF